MKKWNTRIIIWIVSICMLFVCILYIADYYYKSYVNQQKKQSLLAMRKENTDRPKYIEKNMTI